MSSELRIFRACVGVAALTIAAGCAATSEPTKVVAPPSLIPGEWTALAPMPTRRFLAGAAVANGLLYVVGGRNNQSVANHSPADTTLEAYDPATNRWSTLAPMPTRRYEVAAGSVGGIVYAVGGWEWVGNYIGVSAILEAYDPATDRWTAKASMPHARTNPMVASLNGTLYAVGGLDSVHIVDRLDAYDPATDSWATKAPLPVPVNAAGIATVGGKLYVVGGTADTGAVNSVYVYDPVTDRWAAVAPMPTARYGLSVGEVNGKLYAAGGYGDQVAEYLSTVEVYDPVADVWTTSAPMRDSLAYLNVAGIGGHLYAVGGGRTRLSYGDSVTSLLEAYTPH